MFLAYVPEFTEGAFVGVLFDLGEFKEEVGSGTFSAVFTFTEA